MAVRPDLDCPSSLAVGSAHQLRVSLVGTCIRACITEKSQWEFTFPLEVLCHHPRYGFLRHVGISGSAVNSPLAVICYQKGAAQGFPYSVGHDWAVAASQLTHRCGNAHSSGIIAGCE